MEYRQEIDGLRALAVLPVIFFHAGVQSFSGGFVGVDIFFVISGYLITSIIFSELEQGKFSITHFYERRARRILPALFIVMLTCLIAGYFTLMPDEFKNLGQSVVATTLFSNNILLAITSGYWDLASEFKPLLHTWSLGAEEQYYIIFPVLVLLLWKYKKLRNKIILLFAAALIVSLLLAIYLTSTSPKWAFYILPTRAWEILLGAITAIYLRNNTINIKPRASEYLSIIGVFFIGTSIALFDQNYPSPSYFMLLPTIGAILIIIFARKGTLTHLILSQPLIVLLGLISYSLYLWHQPAFAFARIISTDRPSTFLLVSLIPAITLISYLSWKFIEKPFRNPRTISRSNLVFAGAGASFAFISIGILLNSNYGFPERIFDAGVQISDMDKRIYNERVFGYKKSEFQSAYAKKVLIVGNSFARDFVNMTTENFNTKDVNIVYRDDLEECILPYKSELSKTLFSKADVIVFASGSFSVECLEEDISYSTSLNKKIFYSGTKHFGYNLNWIIRSKPQNRPNQYNKLPQETLMIEAKMQNSIPSAHFISLLRPTVIQGSIPITDNDGRMLSTDRAHLTKFGAIYFGTKALNQSSYVKLFVAEPDMDIRKLGSR
ncbi:hypothetical protein CCR95_18365 [Thiocystis minor]|uniref:acyltransferase family protein n=1 Tax=Thiocystis minor TaxID=61597 RepID=UPI0019140B7E|nr:acyltransferase [Thiocystis minor]MBK5965986.1 hypothetical protein [Thiocystis minor]